MGSKKVIALSGGVGGAKLSQGLAAVMPPEDLTVIVNTGDDSPHYGLFVCPDIDTQLYTLSGRADLERGWGRRDETWNAMGALRELGEDIWFNIGDQDLGLNLLRTMRLARGDRLTEITADFARSFGLTSKILPMSDQHVSTLIRCSDRDYEFHEWFVEARCGPQVVDVIFRGAEDARMTREVKEAFEDPGLCAVVVCPSNPYLSIAPILAVPGMREVLRSCRAPVIGVTPVVGGEAVKGPTAAMMTGFDIPVTAASAAMLHADIFDGYVVDRRDGEQVAEFGNIGKGLAAKTHDTMMVDLQAKSSLANSVLDFAEDLGGA
ncbi:2-phospho-L-lactate transferase [Roseibium aggregatum]|uniref:2-phospho-L-lactate transferase n=1 Tax=Roseibium aggregatum TaxID=187304 RepID=A0A939EFU4_9HYPH|nr:2-phospho-L-lactate transferase [Roseibium aggregatum]MBN9670990.1 2-phospho-L-lactate transferase [Roseibium aggregatum]